jgi:hypothetical protein
MRWLWHQGTLVELVQSDIVREGDLLGPDWRDVVADAVFRQALPDHEPPAEERGEQDEGRQQD